MMLLFHGGNLIKPFFVIFILISILNYSFAQTTERKAIIHSIDEYDFPYDYVEVSDEALPSEFNQQLKRILPLYSNHGS